ncbi:MAG: response regulator [Thermodesulfovibrionales bacterium]|nr:response regulator [Thermodesulfovibrionales bacterium]
MERYKILLVDDDVDHLAIVSRILKKEGFEVNTVSTGLECLKVVKTYKPDLILLDILLPDISGYEVCRLIKSDSDTQDIIIIYLTSVNRSSDIKAEGYQKGADGYIIRPISNNELLSIIHAYLRVLKKARQLQRSEQRFNLLSDLSFEGLVVHDKENILDVNQTLLKMMGYNSIEELPKTSSILDFVAPDSRDLVLEKLSQNFEGTYVANLIRKNGSIFPAEINVKNITINKQPARAVSIRDITERYLLEREVKLALNKAIEASKMKSQFVANVSHEIRTPIHSILTITELIKDTHLTKEQLEYVEMARIAAQNLLDIVNDILDISKIEAGKIEIERIDFDLYDLIDTTLQLLKYQAKAKGLEIRYQKDDALPQYLKGDVIRLKQVLMNLLNNAIKFTDAGHVSLTIRFHSKKSPEELVILFIVSDTGIGISQEKQETIFDSFIQEDGSISRRYGGTGLGLTICKNLVQLMGGNIWVESEVGKGSSFYFTLPFKIGKKPAKKEDSLEDVKDLLSTSKTIKILLAEDNEINKVLTKRVLEKHGFTVKTVSSGSEVLETLSNNEDFDVVLMDIQMPEIDGIKATEIIRGHISDTRYNIKRRDIPIIALTANAMKEDRELCISVGMDDYISKPIDVNTLLGVLKRVLHKK